MLDDPELITPAGALQMMLAVSAPHLAGKVTLEWFHQKQRDHAEVEWQPCRGDGFPLPGRFALKQGLDIAARLDEETQIAADAVAELYAHIRELKIGLWGISKDGKDRSRISKDHRQTGDLNIWTEVFECDVPAFRYTAVRCVKADVMEIVNASIEHVARIVGPAPAELSAEQQPLPDAPRTHSKQYKRDLARAAIDALWSPDGAPDTVAPKEICSRVAGWLKVNGHPSVSDDTILRAAGRK